MMGVYVKGMKMPKNCDDCFFIGRGCPDWCSLPQIPNGEDEIDDTKKRPDWCPLVEIPEPHGRLIDAEKLKNEYPHDTDWHYPVNTNCCVCESIDNAQTVIEAEGE